MFFLICSAFGPVHGAPAVAPVAAGEGAPLARDIVSAGRLRMQSQRLAKLNQEVLLGIHAAAAQQQMPLAVAEVDGEFARLARYAKSPNVQRAYTRSEMVWQEMRVLLKMPRDGASGARLNQLADELMLHAGKLAMQIEAEGETPVGRLLDLSSRLNMLAQRLARLYLQAQGGDRSQGVLTDIEQARREFSSGLYELDTAMENTQASREAIALAKNQWIFFESAVRRLGKPEREPDKPAIHVATSSERIAQVLEAASMQYVRDYAEAIRRPK